MYAAKKTKIIILLIAIMAIGVGLWLAQSPDSSVSESQNQNSLDSPEEKGAALRIPSALKSSSPPEQAFTQGKDAPTSALNESTDAVKIEQGEAPGSSEFSRAEFFKPQDWSSDLSTLAVAEQQKLAFNPSCKNHPRNNPTLAPAEWAESFTLTQAQQRWPSTSAHVIDWNQFWQLNDVGYQISIRWNFETPPLYNVVGYSFAVQRPDGYGAPVFPEKMQITWEEAKTFVQGWEKKILTEGGKPGTRTMSLADKVFHPAEVSPQDIERAEYANGRVRSAQTGKMSCTTPFNDLSSLTCTCWF